MSYSFSVRGATAAIVLAAAAAAFDERVIAPMPVHKLDRDAALANAEKHLSLIAEPAVDEEIVLAVHGSLGGDIDWTTGEARRVSNAGSGCTAWLEKKPAQA